MAFVDGEKMLENMLLEYAEKAYLKKEFASIGEANESRMEIMRQYVGMRKHPQLFDVKKVWQKDWMDPQFQEAISKESDKERNESLLSIMRKVGTFLFRLVWLPFFDLEFCAA